MSAIRAVLLVPHDGDPHGLLRDGPYGARPPVAYKVGDDPWVAGRITSAYFGEARLRGWPLPVGALVLAWEGEVVWQGCEVLDHVDDHDISTWRYPYVVREVLLYGAPAMDGPPWPGTLLLLDADGRELVDGD